MENEKCACGITEQEWVEFDLPCPPNNDLHIWEQE